MENLTSSVPYLFIYLFIFFFCALFNTLAQWTSQDQIYSGKEKRIQNDKNDL